MSEARLNFSDHPDSTFSCQAIFHGGYDPKSPSHQAARILERYIASTREAIPEDRDEEETAGRPTLRTEAFMQFSDEAGGCRMRIQCVPRADSPAYLACMQAKTVFEYMHKACSDALVTREDGLTVVVGRDVINQKMGNL